MGKSSGSSKKTTMDDLKKTGPGLSDPGPQLQLTSLGSMPAGPIDFANGGFAAQLNALPEGLRQQIMAASQPPEQPQPQFQFPEYSPLGALGRFFGLMFSRPDKNYTP